MSCDRVACLIGALDLRPWSGMEVMDFGAGGSLPLDIPSWGTGEGFFFDAITALNGRGREVGLPARVGVGFAGTAAPGTAGAEWDPDTGTIALVATDVAITLEGHADNVLFGFPAAGMGPALRLVAPSAPTADFTTAAGLTITPTGFASFTVLAETWVDTLTVEMHQRDAGGVEDLAPYDCLEAQGVGGVDASVRFGLGVDGHVVISYDSSLPSPTWLSTTFRNALGFTGSEVATVTGAAEVLRAARQLPAVQMLREGWDLEAGAIMPGEAEGDLAGSGAGNTLGRFGRLFISFQVTGPGHATNDHMHWIRRARPGRAEPLSFYPRGPAETRRTLEPYDVTADQPAYSLTHTSAAQGYAGRIPARLAAESSEDERISFQGPAAIYSTPVEVILAEDPTA